MREAEPLFSPMLERALRRCAVWHRDQVRRGAAVPYAQHPISVAWILERLGFPEPVVIAGLLHDAVEDTDVTLERIQAEFGADVAAIVAGMTERKLDDRGQKRPWIDRKTEHLDALVTAPIEVRAVALADKLHNLTSIQSDLHEGRAIWSSFHAARDQVLWYYRTALERCGGGDPRLERLAREGLWLLGEIEAGDPSPGPVAAPPGSGTGSPFPSH